jgi:cytochrome b561
MTQAYHPLARGLHWLMAVLIVGLAALGLYMRELPLSPQKLVLYSWHKWVGVSVFALLWLRLAVRVARKPPPAPPTLTARMQWLARAGHVALYGLMLLIPLSGWLMSSAKGVQTVWFGVLPLPDLLARDRELGELLQQVHKALNLLLMASVAGHVAAALWHHFVLRDDTLRRMQPMPWRKHNEDMT